MFQHQELKGSVELLEVVTGLRSRAEHRREQRIALQGRNVVISPRLRHNSCLRGASVVRGFVCLRLICFLFSVVAAFGNG